MIPAGHQSNEACANRKRAQTKKGTLRLQQARGSEPGNRILDGPRITFKKPTCHRIPNSCVADVKESHITPPKHAYSRLPQRRTSTLNLSADARKVNDPKV